ncbi:Annexin, partial [Necator americanus]
MPKNDLGLWWPVEPRTTIAVNGNGFEQLQKLKIRLSGASDDQKQRLLLALMEPAAVYDAKQLRKAMQDALKLYSARQRRFGLENCFIEVLVSRDTKQLELVFEEYEKVAHHSIDAAIQQDFSGTFRDGLFAIVSIVRSKPSYF